MSEDTIESFVSTVFAKYGVPPAEVDAAGSGVDLAGPSGAAR